MRHCIRCQISDEAILIDRPTGLMVIPVDRIIKCENVDYPVYGRYGSIIRYAKNVVLTLAQIRITVNEHSENQLCLMAFDALNGITDTDAETKILYQTIQGIITEQKISIDKNPDQRAFERRKQLHQFSEEEWDALTSPQKYLERPEMKPARATLTMLHEFGYTFYGVFVIVAFIWLLAVLLLHK